MTDWRTAPAAQSILIFSVLSSASPWTESSTEQGCLATSSLSCRGHPQGFTVCFNIIGVGSFLHFVLLSQGHRGTCGSPHGSSSHAGIVGLHHSPGIAVESIHMQRLFHVAAECHSTLPWAGLSAGSFYLFYLCWMCWQLLL